MGLSKTEHSSSPANYPRLAVYQLPLCPWWKAFPSSYVPLNLDQVQQNTLPAGKNKKPEAKKNPTERMGLYIYGQAHSHSYGCLCSLIF